MKRSIGIFLLLPILLCAQEKDSAANSKADPYAQQLRDYFIGRKNYAVLPFLVMRSRQLGKTNTADAISRDYIDNYLMKLNNQEFYNSKNIEFLSDNIRDSKDTGFKIFFLHGKKIDEIMKTKDFAARVIEQVVTKEVVDPMLLQSAKDKITPDWTDISRNIEQKFSTSYSKRPILDAKIRWYGYNKTWPIYCKTVVDRVRKYGPYGMFSDKSWQLNSLAWDLFLHSADTHELKQALEWSKEAIKMIKQPDASYLDTYANLLYKAGKIKDAIQFEQEAINTDQKNQEFKNTLDKMEQGRPTWPKL